jgi:hypothetical protein
MTSMTLEEMRLYREKYGSQSNWEEVRRRISENIEPEFDEDSPDATQAIREMITKQRKGRPKGTANKEQVAIRLDQDILLAFRASGQGWQTRVNAVLREWLHTHPSP